MIKIFAKLNCWDRHVNLHKVNSVNKQSVVQTCSGGCLKGLYGFVIALWLLNELLPPWFYTEPTQSWNNCGLRWASGKSFGVRCSFSKWSSRLIQIRIAGRFLDSFSKIAYDWHTGEHCKRGVLRNTLQMSTNTNKWCIILKKGKGYKNQVLQMPTKFPLLINRVHICVM